MGERTKPTSREHTYTSIPDDLLMKDGLSLNAKVVFGKILNLCKNCKEVTISNGRLSQLICADIRTVQRAKAELRELGLITIIQEEKGRGNLANIQVNKKKVNEYLGFEYFQLEKKHSPAKNDPLAFMESDYYKNKM